MTSILKIFSVIFIISLVLLIVLGLFVKPGTYVTRTMVIESPVNVVWRYLSDYSSYHIWQEGIEKAVLEEGEQLWEGAALRLYHQGKESEFAHEERVVKLDRDMQLSFIREGYHENPLLQDFKTTYLIKRLLDGSTELSINISYHARGFVTRIYNQLYLRSHYTQKIEHDLSALRKLIESS